VSFTDNSQASNGLVTAYSITVSGAILTEYMTLTYNNYLENPGGLPANYITSGTQQYMSSYNILTQVQSSEVYFNENIDTSYYQGNFEKPPYMGYGTEVNGSFGSNINWSPLSLSRQNLTQIQASTTAPAGGEFTYATTALTGKTINGIQYAAGVTAATNPNTADLTDPKNPSATGVPSPGGLAQVTAIYTTGEASGSDSFLVPTFGISCYVTALQSDYGTPPTKCHSGTYNKVKYSGTVSNPYGLEGTYCSWFIENILIQGSATLNDGTDVQWNGNAIVPVSAINGADGTPVVANQTVARDRGPLPKCSINSQHSAIIPDLNTLIDLDQIGTGLLANDTGCKIAGYRIDLYTGPGVANCPKTYKNIMSVAACNPSSSTCPSSTIQ
jgi:3D (Asp-Asp-Asp) domain-containing protein